MLVTRLKHGHRIRLSDTEYAALVHLVELGTGDIESMTDDDWKALRRDRPDVVRGISSFMEFGCLSVSDDRRGTD